MLKRLTRPNRCEQGKADDVKCSEAKLLNCLKSLPKELEHSNAAAVVVVDDADEAAVAVADVAETVAAASEQIEFLEGMSLNWDLQASCPVTGQMVASRGWGPAATWPRSAAVSA